MPEDKQFVKEITSRDEDYSQWYQDLVLKAEMMDYAPIKGFMAIRPYGYAIWEKIQELLDKRFKAAGHQNAYFPVLIPESLLQKEADHVEGFAPEVAWVTQGGQEPLAERLLVRPTSEAIICSMYARWIQSYRDLPVKLNQWCNVVRWEKSTRPFLRTSEFLWQEGHTVHRSHDEAEEETLLILSLYKDFVENDLAIPVIDGIKSESEKFAGALRTYTIEAMMTDGKALQAGTSHNLGQHFAKVFDIKFLDEDQLEKYPWQTSWGVSTRLIGALVMVHGDNRGLALPPKIAPVQAVIVPIMPKKSKNEVMAAAKKLFAELESSGMRVHLDDREEYSPGWKFNEWEMKGVPLRIEIGPRDLEKGQVVLVRRDTGSKEAASVKGLPETAVCLLQDIQSGMYRKAKEFMLNNTRKTDDYNEFKQIIEQNRGFVKAPWCGSAECEARIKTDTKATIRCLPFEGGKGKGRCIACGKETDQLVYFARSY